MLHFGEPDFLILLLLLPVVWLMARRLRLIARGRRLSILIVRTLMLLCVIFALARLEYRRQARELSTFFLLDYSDSIPRELQEQQLKELDRLSKLAKKTDETGVIVFGAEPSLETSPAANFDFEGRILSSIDGTRSDIGSAVRLALAAFPGDRMKRIVLFSDGNENSGSALEMARYAKNSGVPIDVLPLSYDARNDVRIEKLVVPQRTAKDAPFDLKVFLQAQKETTGKLSIFQDGELIIQDTVTVKPGRNAPLVLPQRLKEGGFHTYTATLEAQGDMRQQNNRANAFTYLKAEPKVLLIEGGDDTNSIGFLAQALRTENLSVEMGGPSQLPVSLDELQKYDSVILSNVSADRMSVAQMQMIERGVHDLGIGLVMIGGENSFGAGGYMDTPIEQALPVSMDVKQKKMLPNGALVIVLHTCEIPSGNAWAREISIASLNVLSAQDYFGLVYWGPPMTGIGSGYAENWAWDPPLAQVGNKKMMRTAIKGVQPSDMPNFDPTIQLAADELVAVKAQTKHMVIISDGDPAPPSQALVNKIRNAGITVSAVAIAPHDGMTVTTMQQLAYWGSGNFYYPKTAAELPRIFTKEAVVVRKSLIREEKFTPKGDAYSEVLQGFTGLPPLDGYVITSIKDLATQALVTEWDDPLLAHWRYGLGKTVAFTSDAKNKWAAPWVSWGSFSKFWAQTIRWSLRETNSPNFQVNTEIQGGTGKVTIDAVDEAGNFQNFLDFNAAVIGPDFQSKPLGVRQVAPGRYEANFPASQVGTYMLSMATGEKDKSGGSQFLTTGVSLSYSPEYETSTSSDEFLARVADTSGGRLVKDPLTYNPYLRDLKPQRRPEPLWPLLLLLGTLLLPADVFLRRVYLDWAEMSAWVKAKLFGILPHREKAEAYNQRMDTLRAAKDRATKDKEEEKREKEARETFRGRLEQKRSEGTPQGSVFEAPDATKQPTRRTTKETYSADEGNAPKPPPGAGGMANLMEAKKRAQQKKKGDGGG